MTPPIARFQNKVAIVTGASRGIGAAIARRIASEGAQVVIASRKADGLKAIESEINGAGGAAFAQACHVGKPEQVDALVAAAIERFGRVDVLINNAGTNPHFGPMLQCEWPAFDKTFEVNLKGYYYPTKLVVDHMVKRGEGGAIVNISSVLGFRAAPLQGVYAMTKAAVISMTRTLAVELGASGIRVNAISPGLIDTRLSSAIVNNDTLSKHVIDRTSLGRVGQPDEIAGAAAFLASADSTYVTGSVLVVDGGWTLQ